MKWGHNLINVSRLALRWIQGSYGRLSLGPSQSNLAWQRNCFESNLSIILLHKYLSKGITGTWVLYWRDDKSNSLKFTLHAKCTSKIQLNSLLLSFDFLTEMKYIINKLQWMYILAYRDVFFFQLLSTNSSVNMVINCFYLCHPNGLKAINVIEVLLDNVHIRVIP